jgi:Acyl-protein synthetase, LuxE
MFNLDEIIDTPPFSLSKDQKSFLFQRALRYLTEHHYGNCLPYKNILDKLKIYLECAGGVAPFFPVRLFKELDLYSVSDKEIFKTMSSSGTSGSSVSKIFLDRITSANQTKVLTKIATSFFGKRRLPMLIIDSPSVLKDRKLFSARGAGILGFSIFGRDVRYALDDNMELDLEGVVEFLKGHEGEDILIFGFTFMIWEHFFLALKKKGIRVPLERGILIHGGGWKKLIDMAVDADVFRQSLFDVCGITKVHNYYGMVEQTGSIFMECEFGYLHASIFSDIYIRDLYDFRILDFQKQGVIQLLSLLPTSYPGHSILTEDVGEIFGEDDCRCGRLGKYFKVYGRIPNAEIRGCSDVYANSV